MNYKKCILTCYIFSFFISGILHAEDTAYQGKFPTLESWIQAFKSLPKNREGANPAIHSGFAPCGDKKQQWQEVQKVLQAYLLQKKNGPLADKSNWNINDEQKTKPDEKFFDLNTKPTFTPFAQKLITNPGSNLYIHGDLHGDIFSLLEELKKLQSEGIIDNNFKIIKPDTNLLFLGDYVDRGNYGTEVLYTIARLTLANPDNVIALRGNHENINMFLDSNKFNAAQKEKFNNIYGNINWIPNTFENESEKKNFERRKNRLESSYGFVNEVQEKFEDLDKEKYLLLNRTYDFLPTVFYLGSKDENKNITNYIQCCHAGIDDDYNPKTFLNTKDTNYQIIEQTDHMGFPLGEKPANPNYSGHLWSDFHVNSKQKSGVNLGRGFIYSKEETEEKLQKYSSETSKVNGIIRGHQHDEKTMPKILASNGVYKLWKSSEKKSIRFMKDGKVWTFNVGPDTPSGEYFNFNYDTFARLQTAQDYKNWHMEVINTLNLPPTSILDSNTTHVATMLVLMASSLGIYYKDNIKKTYLWLKTYLANQAHKIRNTLKGSPSEKKLLTT